MADDNPPFDYGEVIQKIDKANAKLDLLQKERECGPACKKDIKKDKLLKRWMDAGIASSNLEDYKAEYLIFTEGKNKYEKDRLAMATSRIKDSAHAKECEFGNVLRLIDDRLKTLKSLRDIKTSTKSALSSASARLKLDNRTKLQIEAERNVADRMAYYESAAAGRVDSLNSFLYYTFLVLYVVGIVRVFSVGSNFTAPSAWIVVIFLGFLLVFGRNVAGFLYNTLGMAYSIMKNILSIAVYVEDQNLTHM
tara:strand:- start:157 stop:909 length:753 start_codon:yes stop_codon:yes gene_type:complete